MYNLLRILFSIGDMPKKVIEWRADRTDLGVNLQSSRNLNNGEMSQGQSMRHEHGSGVFTGPGYRLKKDLAQSAQGDGMCEAYVFPALWVKTGTKLFYSETPENPSTWYDAGATLTTETLTTIIEQGNGDIHATNGTDSPTRIIVAKAKGAIISTDTEISVGTVHITKFSAAGGTIRINDDEITYTGTDTGTGELTGVTGIAASGHAQGSLIVEDKTMSTWSEEKGTWAFKHESRLIVGGRTDYEEVVYASAPEDLDNPQYFYDFDGNGTVTRRFDTPMVGGISGQANAYLFGKNGVYQFRGFDIATGAFLVDPIAAYTAYNSRCIVDMDGTIAFLGDKRLLPIELQLSQGGGPTQPFLSESFDHRLRPWLDELDDGKDQADAHLHYDKTNKILKIWARRNGTLECRVYDRQGDAFLGTEIRSTSVNSMFQGKSYFCDKAGKVQRDDQGLTNAGIPVVHKWSTGRMEYDKGRQEFQLYRFEYEGWMTKGSKHTVRVYVDGSSLASYEYEFDDSLITTTKGNPLGKNNIGVSSLAADGETVSAFPYKNNILLRGIGGDDVRLEWEITREGSFFQLNSFYLSAYLLTRSQRTYN